MSKKQAELIEECVERGFIWQRPDGWWIASCGSHSSRELTRRETRAVVSALDELVREG